MGKKMKEFLFINIGLFLVAIGIYYFLVPNNIAAGGVSGIAIVLNHFIPQISVGAIMLVMNVILLIIGMVFIGVGFGIKTIYSGIALSSMVWLLGVLYPISEPIMEDILIQLIYGIGLSAIGIAIVFNQEASTGGTDILARILNKYYKLNIGKSLLIVDFIVVILAVTVFGIKLGMYALLGVFMNGFIIDNVIEGFNISKEVVIISSKSKMITEFIVKEMERGATLYTAKGGFTNEEKEVIVTFLGRREFIRLRNYIKEKDPKAFIAVSHMHEILGEGFKILD